jgi:hypothetical protein
MNFRRMASALLKMRLLLLDQRHALEDHAGDDRARRAAEHLVRADESLHVARAILLGEL